MQTVEPEIKSTKVEWPKHGITKQEIANSPFSGDGSIVVRKDGRGLRRVTPDAHYRYHGIPKLNEATAAKFLEGSNAKVKWVQLELANEVG